MSSWPFFGFRRQHHDHAEVVARRVAQLVHEHRDELGRPEELALEVDQPLGRAQSPQVALQDPEVAARERAVDVARNRAHDLQLDVSGGSGRLRKLELLPRHLAPAQREVRGDVGDGRALEARGRVVPAEPLRAPDARDRRAGRPRARSGRSRRRTRRCRRRSRASRDGSASAARARRGRSGSAFRRRARRSPRAPRAADGWKSGSGAPAQARTRTSTRSAASASTSRSVSPAELELGREVPARQPDVRARGLDLTDDRR